MWLLLDKAGICRCLATLPQNLHKDKIAAGMEVLEVEDGPYLVGDEYDPETGLWTARPENYPQPTQAELNETLIAERTAENARKETIAELEAEGKLSPGWEGVEP